MHTGLTASTLCNRGHQKIVQDVLREHTDLIDAAITSAHAAGFNRVTYELPSAFGISNLSKADQQTFIYSELLQIYREPEPKGKGFPDVSITLDKKTEKNTLHISWQNGMSEEERNARMEIIRQCVRAAPRASTTPVNIRGKLPERK